MTNRTLEQQRAAAALDFVQGQQNNENQRARLHTLIQKAPIMILQNGLGQTLAFLLSKAETKDGQHNAEKLLHDQVDDWLRQQQKIYPVEETLIHQLTEKGRLDYLRAQQESLALLSWMKKFAEAWLKEGE